MDVAIRGLGMEMLFAVSHYPTVINHTRRGGVQTVFTTIGNVQSRVKSKTA